jgi:glycerate kinase
MRVLLAFDKFKDAIQAEAACRLAGEALGQRYRDIVLDLCPLTDGGEGFAGILTRSLHGELFRQNVSGPLGRSVEGEFGLIPFHRLAPEVRRLLGMADRQEGILAAVDMASASGLVRIPAKERNPWKTTSRGTGELCLAAAQRGADLLLLGIGGSGTSDLGLGCLQALGLRARDGEGREMSNLCPEHWKNVSVLEGAVLPDFPPIRVACDVTNPLLGPRGMVRVYGPQKGLPAEDLAAFEKEAKFMAGKLLEKTGKPKELMETPGAGAAGGIGFGLMAWAGAHMVPGAELVLGWLDLPARIRAADVILTGEGRFDRSSLEGKGPSAVINLALAAGKEVHAFIGSVEKNLPLPTGLGLHEITPAGMPLSEALARSGDLLARAVSGLELRF